MPPKPLEPLPEDLQGATVLVVDDERVWRTLLETDLRMLGYRVKMARDGHEALSTVAEHRPEAAIIDLMLPEPMDGLTLLSELRGKGETIPVIFYTAQTEAPPEPPDPQAFAFVSKAADRADLYALLPIAIRKMRGR